MCGRFRIEDVYPCIDGGIYPVKRIAGERIDVWADILRDGHDVIRAALRWKHDREPKWHSMPMVLHSNDRWFGSFHAEHVGTYQFQIEAWTDRFGTWHKHFLAKRKAGSDAPADIEDGLALLRDCEPHDRTARDVIRQVLQEFEATGAADVLLQSEVEEIMSYFAARPDRERSRCFLLWSERERARFGAWYEMVPRSQGTQPGVHGTFEDCIARVPDIASLGFNVLYLTPIHPIGRTNRKGKNNSLSAEADDVGSFYAIGNEDGGHDLVNPQLGTLEDFARLVAACRDHGLEIALDIAVQCSPDHPWLKEHPQWFQRRSDGSIQFAENPPKKYEDIVNPDLLCEDRDALWHAWLDVLLSWIDRGVEIFRIDNPHTKPLPFWQWIICEVRKHNPNVIFLAEAFTRPKLMKALAKIGFSQSYTYFTWRTAKAEIEEYVKELSSYPVREYFRPNFFVTTPDILPFQLQSGQPWLFKARAALAATLSSTYGIYNGFELFEHEPLPGKEEYLNSEKYEIRTRNWTQAPNMRDFLRWINSIRDQHAAFRETGNIHFLNVPDDGLIAFVKVARDQRSMVAVAISISPHAREFWLPVATFTDDAREQPHSIRDLRTGEIRRLDWGGAKLFIDPQAEPAMIFECLA